MYLKFNRGKTHLRSLQLCHHECFMSPTHPVSIDTHHVINVSIIPTPDIAMSPVKTLELLNLHPLRQHKE